MPSPTVPPPSAAQRVYDHTKNAILDGRVQGGELITEGEVAGDLAVSRTPVREAFLRLEAEGWMRLYPKRGALVTPVPDGEREEIRDARVLTECHAVATLSVAGPARTVLAAEQMRHELAHQQQACRADQTEAFARHDAEFHAVLVEAAGNTLLTKFYRSLAERQRRVTALTVRALPLARQDVIDEHTRLADLVAAGDEPAFREALEQHLVTFYGPRA